MLKWNSLLPARSALEHDGGDSSAVWWHKLPSGVGRSDTTITAIATDSTGLYQMLGISCLGWCPAALLETQCAGLQVLIGCQEKKKKRPWKNGGEETWEQILGHANAAFCSDHVFGFKAVAVQPKGWTAHYACWADWAARMSFYQQLTIGKVTL